MQNKYPKKSWMSPKVEVMPSLLHGRGTFTKKLVKAGETVIIFGGDYVSKKEAMKAKNQDDKLVMQFDEDIYTVEERGDDITYFINHSCDPNVWMKRAFTLVARRNIQACEELTADYIFWEADKNYVAKWDCVCGSALCRKKITGKDWRLSELQKSYKNHFTTLLNKRIKNSIKKIPKINKIYGTLKH